MRKLLILDLDETIIHGCLDGPDGDFLAAGIAVLVRPGAAAFLAEMSVIFDLAVWTSASADYAADIVSTLFPRQPLFVWSRERCVRKIDAETGEIHFIKDLKKVRRHGWDLSQVLVVDDSPEKLCRNYGNLVRVPRFCGDPDDILPRLAHFLKTLANVPDVRTIEKRGWLNSAQEL